VQWAKSLNCTETNSPGEACENCLNCRRIGSRGHPDVLWVDFQYQAGLLEEPLEKQRVLKIKTIREMERLLHMRAMEGRRKIALLEPAERLGEDAAHSLLKILEEPPPETHLVLLAQDPSQLLGTIRSRCQWVRFRPVPLEKMVSFLLAKGGDRLSEEDARKVAMSAEGSIGRALALSDAAEELRFDWETASLSELLSWTEGFRSSAEGREAAEEFLHRLLAQYRLEMYAGSGAESRVRRVLEALRQIRQNVSPSLVLQVLLLKMRYEKRGRG
jgi:DNA polymerase III subunit delta'